ncbi:hypothetical protein [Brevibacillus sp. MER 51]|uniref:DUF7167 family protein n=1 Tax=Brevibacillus sp. MER 51 TaxID=2939560 RepID=UPI00203F7CB6|nr:hypothetical protein [Brevibacillus sp. MER 51]MCM3144343.1 hypothetical protein [Brevibacillus sp. MER 51]
MAKFRFSVSTGYVGSDKEEIYEIDDDDLKGLTEEAQESLIQEHYNEWLWEKIYTGWSRID